jgi:HSP20 family molecular chaperone IbpA
MPNYLVTSTRFQPHAAWPSGAASWNNSSWQPRADIYEEGGAFTFEIEVPGLDASQLQVRFEPGQLVVEGVRPQPTCGAERRCVQVESDFGAFRRVFALPRDADAMAIAGSTRKRHTLGFGTTSYRDFAKRHPNQSKISIEYSI